MLEELEIRNLGPISHALITPCAAMTAITGETGAGKSMLLSAIKLISGAKAEVARVSPKAQEAWVQGVFSVEKSCEVANIIREAGIELETSENDDSKQDMYVARTVPQSGRSRATLSGYGAPKTLLETVCSHMITIHGQSDQLRIATSAKQRELLDTVARNSNLRYEYDQAYKNWKDAQHTLDRLENQAASSRQRADYLRESITRIRSVDPQPNEDETLKTKRNRIENAAHIIRAVSTALAALDASQIDYESSVESADACMLIDKAAQALRTLHVDDTCETLAHQLDDVHAQLSDIVMQLARMLDVDGSDEDLDALNSRIHDLTELTRRWGPTLDDVLDWAEKAQFELEDLDDSPEAIERARAACNKHYREALTLAKELSKTRAQAAEKLSSEVTAELKSLAMSGAQLNVLVNPRNEDAQDSDVLDSHGIDDVEFLFRPFPASDDLPIGKSASGGELSRLMLAMELVVAQLSGNDESMMTFIFDEVDAGVGGVAAVELGKRLAQLAQHAQVIVVTHLAQVASFANAQFAVQKTVTASSDDDQSQYADTTVTKLEGVAREQEIARMLAGSESQTSLEHARELLATSRKMVDNVEK